MTTNLIVPITQSLSGSAEAATAIAVWLENTGRDLTGELINVSIANVGYGIQITSLVTLTPADIRAEHFKTSSAPWIKTAKNGSPPAGVSIIDYEAERKHNSDYYAYLKTLRESGSSFRALAPEQRAELETMAPRPYWPVAAVINQMGALNAYNKSIERWNSCRNVYPELVVIIWTMCSGQPHAVEAAMQQWQELAKEHGLEKSPLLAATQVVNPEQGKGANRAKADALTIGGQEGFWLLEYFKFAGLYQAALPRTVQGRKDRKTYVVLPARGGISMRWYRQIFTAFQQQFWATTAIKMDIQALLRYTATMLGQWEAAQQSTGRRRRASDYVDGFAVASFKDLGSAVAVMNVATLRLPDWIDWPTSLEQATTLRTTVEEHRLLTAALEEKKGEEEALLRQYRDFLSSRDPALAAYFDFMAGYAGHSMRKLARRQPVRRFSTDNVETIIMANDERRKDEGERPLMPILESQGFRNIASAIRQSTVTQQYYKSRQNDNTYEIRYGLGDELRRKSRENLEFSRAISEFLQQYSQENARIQERSKGKPYRRRISVSTRDIEDLMRLVDEYGAATVANLLVAIGYAYDPRASDPKEGTMDDTPDDGETPDTELDGDDN